MTSPIDRLNETEKTLQQAIKIIATKFNEVNKRLRDFKIWLLATKKAIDVTGQNVQIGKRNEDNFKVMLIDRIIQTKNKIEEIRKGYIVFEELINSIRLYVQDMQRIMPLRSFNRLIVGLGTLMSETQSNTSNLQELLLQLSSRFDPISLEIQSAPAGFSSRIGQIISNMYTGVYDSMDHVEYLQQRIMRDVLQFYSYQFKIYGEIRGHVT